MTTRTAPRLHPCGRRGAPHAPHGFTRPGGIRAAREGDVTLWACAEHREDARARAAEIMGYELGAVLDRRDAPRDMRPAMQPPAEPRQAVLL